MNARQLKNSILQMAVQGRLVPQDPNDEPASVLLERIRAEKQRLIRLNRLNKEGKIKKDKNESVIYRGQPGARTQARPTVGARFIAPNGPNGDEPRFFERTVDGAERDITDELPFKVPETWEWVRLNSIALTILAGGDKPKDFTTTKTNNCQIPVIANGVTNNGVIGYTKTATIHEKSITISGRGTIGFSCVRKNPYCPVVRLISVIPSENVNVEYLCYVFELLFERGVGTSIPQLTVPMVSPKIVPLPPLAEQRRIVERIEQLLPHIAEYDDAEQKLTALNAAFPDQIKKSILQAAVQGKLVEQNPNDEPASLLLERIRTEKEQLIKAGKIKKEKPLPPITEDEIPFDIPESWKWVRLNGVVNEISTGPFGSMLHKSDYVNCGIPLVNPQNIVDGLIQVNEKTLVSDKTAKRLSSYSLYENDIVIARRGEMGRCAVVGKSQAGWLCGTGCFILRNNQNIFSAYLAILIRSGYSVDYLTGSSIGTTMSNLNHNILNSFLVPLPPLAEQNRIVAKCEELLPLIERCR